MTTVTFVSSSAGLFVSICVLAWLALVKLRDMLQ